jgi:hypothetical protein
MFNKILISKEKLLIIYKLLNDTLFILLALFTSALIAEGLLPGIVSNHVGLYKIAFLILVNLFIILFLFNKLKISHALSHDKKALVIIFLLFIILIFNGMLNIKIILSIFILFLVSIVFYLFYKIIGSEAD